MLFISLQTPFLCLVFKKPIFNYNVCNKFINMDFNNVINCIIPMYMML